MTFEDLGLGPDILRAVADAGYTDPTPIQAQAIPVLLQGRDVLGCAQTGTGKTASFTLPMIEILSTGRARARMPRSLILTPTRELATQIAQHFEIHGKYHKLTMALLIGGVSLEDQQRKLSRGVDVLIATPGRMLDLFGRGSLLLTDVKILVIDEADRMLDMGFIPDVERIVKLLPPIRQTLMFSATLWPEIRSLADKFLISPKEITVAPPATTVDTVAQSLTTVSARDKGKALRALLRAEDVGNALIFCNRKKDVDLLDRSLRRHGFRSAALHGDMAQSARGETLARFKAGEIDLLVATDVAGRGIDIKGLSHVLNFDVPLHAEDYVHRIGRTGRAGQPGRALTLATPADAKYVKAITDLIGAPIPVRALDEVASVKPARDEKRPARPAREARPEPAPAKADGEQSGRRQRKHKAAEGKTKPKPKAKANKAPVKGNDEPVVGMGDHVPAFMRVPIRAAG